MGPSPRGIGHLESRGGCRLRRVVECQPHAGGGGRLGECQPHAGRGEGVRDALLEAGVQGHEGALGEEAGLQAFGRVQGLGGAGVGAVGDVAEGEQAAVLATDHLEWKWKSVWVCRKYGLELRFPFEILFKIITAEVLTLTPLFVCINNYVLQEINCL